MAVKQGYPAEEKRPGPLGGGYFRGRGLKAVFGTREPGTEPGTGDQESVQHKGVAVEQRRAGRKTALLLQIRSVDFRSDQGAQGAPRRRSSATPHKAAFEDGGEMAVFQQPANGGPSRLGVPAEWHGRRLQEMPRHMIMKNEVYFTLLVSSTYFEARQYE